MRIDRPGLIIFVERYEDCVAFYRDVVGLEVGMAKAWQTDGEPGGLTAFHFGKGYLMLESGGTENHARNEGPSYAQGHRTVLRFDVEDLPKAMAELRAKGIAVELRRYDWGEIGIFYDPDGNRCEIKSPLTGGAMMDRGAAAAL